MRDLLQLLEFLLWPAGFIVADCFVEFSITIQANRRRKKIQAETGHDGVPNWVQKFGKV